MVRFTKMEGLGNDYIYLNGLREQVPETELPALAVAVSDRHFGIGSDGLIAILPPRDGAHDFRFRMFNADGSEGEMCGNGIRCFARYCYDRGLTGKTELRVDTTAGTIIPRLVLGEGGRVTGVRVDMGEPRRQRQQMPMGGGDPAGPLPDDVELRVDGFAGRFACVSVGNPHIVAFVDDVAPLDLSRIGPPLEHHPLFPRRTNVHWVQVLGPRELRMRTWERGSGITLACGTGACAVLVAAARTGRSERQATLHLPGGDLQIEWAADNHVYMTGPAEYVCDGEFTRPWH